MTELVLLFKVLTRLCVSYYGRDSLNCKKKYIVCSLFHLTTCQSSMFDS